MTSRARVVVALFTVSILGAFITGRDLFYNLVYLWGFLLVSSYTWARLTLLGVRLEREAFSTRAQVGQLFTERFTLVNESRIPKIWIEARDKSELPGYKVTSTVAGLGRRGLDDRSGHRASTVTINLGSHHRRTWIQRTVCTRRGRYRIGPLELHSGDLFGLFPVKRDVPSSQHLLVLPMVVPIRRFSTPTGRISGGEAIRKRTHQVTPNVASVRDYSAGDNLNRIHWPSTAKRQRLIVKEFELDPQGEVWLLLDAARKNRYVKADRLDQDERSVWIVGETRLPLASDEYGIAAAASLGIHFLDLDRSVGLIAYGDARHVIQPDRGEAQRYRLLESLAVLNADGVHDLDQVLRVEYPRIPRGSTVIVITAAAGPVVMGVLRRLIIGDRRPILISLDASTFGGPEDTNALPSAAGREGVPVIEVRCGDSLEDALNLSSRRRLRPTAVQGR
ncbi:MAG: DUF58 domain-containing protein [Anaerolineales bacterium]|jgi:uncharacterized protein (DUF58 family)